MRLVAGYYGRLPVTAVRYGPYEVPIPHVDRICAASNTASSERISALAEASSIWIKGRARLADNANLEAVGASDGTIPGVVESATNTILHIIGVVDQSRAPRHFGNAGPAVEFNPIVKAMIHGRYEGDAGQRLVFEGFAPSSRAGLPPRDVGQRIEFLGYAPRAVPDIYSADAGIVQGFEGYAPAAIPGNAEENVAPALNANPARADVDPAHADINPADACNLTTVICKDLILADEQGAPIESVSFEPVAFDDLVPSQEPEKEDNLLCAAPEILPAKSGAGSTQGGEAISAIGDAEVTEGWWIYPIESGDDLFVQMTYYAEQSGDDLYIE